MIGFKGNVAICGHSNFGSFLELTYCDILYQSISINIISININLYQPISININLYIVCIRILHSFVSRSEDLEKLIKTAFRQALRSPTFHGDTEGQERLDGVFDDEVFDVLGLLGA